MRLDGTQKVFLSLGNPFMHESCRFLLLIWTLNTVVFVLDDISLKFVLHEIKLGNSVALRLNKQSLYCERRAKSLLALDWFFRYLNLHFFTKSLKLPIVTEVALKIVLFRQMFFKMIAAIDNANDLVTFIFVSLTFTLTPLRDIAVNLKLTIIVRVILFVLFVLFFESWRVGII